MAEGNGDRVEFAPAPGNQRLGAFRELVRIRSSWPSRFKKALWCSTPSESAMRAVPMLEE